MEQRTKDMFASTCNYLNFMIKDIIESNIEIPSDSFIIVNELILKLSTLKHDCSQKNNSFRDENSLSRDQDNNYACNSLVNSENNFLLSAENDFEVTQTEHGAPQSSPFHNKKFLDSNDIKSIPNQKVADSPNVLASTKNSNPSQKSLKNIFTPSSSDSNFLTLNNSSSNPQDLASSDYKVIAGHSQSANPSATEHGIAQTSDIYQLESTTSSKFQNNLVSKYIACSDEDENTISSELSEGNVYFTKLFCKFIDTICQGEINSHNKGVYCRLCNALCMTSWSDHVSEKDHVYKESKLKNLRMYSCRICKICLYGRKITIIKYFKYHYEKIHFSNKNFCWEECLVEIENLYLPSSISTSDSVSSLNKVSLDKALKKTTRRRKKTVASPVVKKNDTSCSPSPNINKNSSVSTSASPTVSAFVAKPKLEENKKTDDVLAKHSKIDTVIESSDKILPSSPYPQFDFILNEVLEEWQRTSIKLDAGFCTLCNIGILSGYDWFSHSENHSQGSTDCKEEICPTCNVKIYGLEHQKYFDLPNHVQLDKAFKSASLF